MHLYGLTVRARGQAGGYICRDTNALTRRSVLNTVRLDRLLRGLDIHANMHAPTGNQSADRQRTVHTHKQAQKEKFVWIGVQGFLFAEEYRVVVCWDAPAVSSCAHIETQMTAHFPASIWNAKNTIDPPATHSPPK